MNFHFPIHAREAFRIARPARALSLAAALALLTTAAGALPEGYFPPTEERPANDREWAELAKRFPLQVKKNRPARPAASEAFPPSTATTIRPGLKYFRVHSIERDLETLAASLDASATIVDLRFVEAGEVESLELAAILARGQVELVLGGQSAPEPLELAPAATGQERGPTLVLTNRATSGPVESVLAALQQSGDILVVGEKTKGNTGRFKPVADHPRWKVIDADFRSPGGPSLLGKGVAPDLVVTVSPVDDETAYRAFDAGAPIAALLDANIEKARFDEARLLQQHDLLAGDPRSPALPPPATGADSNRPASPEAREARPAPIDRILHRAVNIVVALRALRRFSDS